MYVYMYIYCIKTHSATIPNQKFIIPTANLDSETIRVNVRENANSSSLTKFEKVSNILDVSANDPIFFVQ